MSQLSDDQQSLDRDPNQGESELVVRSVSPDKMKYDHLMMKWNEIAPIPGQKHQHSSNHNNSGSRGRVVVKCQVIDDIMNFMYR